MKTSAHYAEAAFFLTERDADFWEAEGHLFCEPINLPDEGEREVYEEVFIQENHPDKDFSAWLAEELNASPYKVSRETHPRAEVEWSDDTQEFEMVQMGPSW